MEIDLGRVSRVDSALSKSLARMPRMACRFLKEFDLSWGRSKNKTLLS